MGEYLPNAAAEDGEHPPLGGIEGYRSALHLHNTAGKVDDDRPLPGDQARPPG